MDRTATIIAAALLFVGLVVILIGVGPPPEPAPPNDAEPTPIFFGARPAEASFVGDEGAEDAQRETMEPNVAAVTQPLVVEVRDRATGELSDRLPLHIRWREPGVHWSSPLLAESPSGGRAEIPRSEIPVEGDLLFRVGSFARPLVDAEVQVERLRTRLEPLVLEIDPGAWQSLFLADPDGNAIDADPWASPSSVRIFPGSQPGWHWIALETCPNRHMTLGVGKLPEVDVELPARRQDTPVVVVVPFAWDLRVCVDGARDAARYSVHVLLPDSMERRPHYLTKYHKAPATAGEDTPGNFRDAHPRGEPRPIWRLGLNRNAEAVLRGFAEPGSLDVVLLDLGVPIARKKVDLDGHGGERVVAFEIARQGEVLTGMVVDGAGAPIAGTRLLLDPDDGREEDHPFLHRPRDPVPAVQVATDAGGRFRLPVRDGMGARFVLVHADGYGRRVLTVDELRVADSVVLRPGRTVRMTTADRNGRPVSESTSWNTGGTTRLEALVELEHGVWRPASVVEWSQGIDRHGHDSTIGDIWMFHDLPEGVLRFAMSGSQPDSWTLHASSLPSIHWIGKFDNDELMLGK